MAIDRTKNRHQERQKGPEDEEGVDIAPELLGFDDPDDAIMEENEDGSVDIKYQRKGPEDNADFYSNILGKISPEKREMFAIDMLEKIAADRQARQGRDNQYEEGLRRTGLGADAPGGAQFNGASKVIHPALAEACVDFAARAIKELFPAQGPVKTQIIGEKTASKENRAGRKMEFMNWQLTEQIEEYKDELEQNLTQLPLGGSQYTKWFWCSEHKRPMYEFVPIDKIIIPYAASSLYNAPRFAEIQDMTEQTYLDRIDEGLYEDDNPGNEEGKDDDGQLQLLIDPPQPTGPKMANDSIEGKHEDTENIDGLRRVYHVYCKADFDDGMAPYIAMIDERNKKLVGVYRNWEDGDETKIRLDWITEWKFIPWRGAYGIGLPHLIGSLAAALTGALRALMDSAHINNMPGLLKLKGAKIAGQSNSIDPTQVSEIESAPGIDDVKKLVMPMPYNPPSPVLFQLLGWLTDAAKGVIKTAEESMSEMTDRTPVGTAQAKMEAGAHVYSAIHARLHLSQKRSLKILQRLNRWHFDDISDHPIAVELGVREDDFSFTSDIIPVSDPDIFSETQRYAQVQSLLQLMAMNPGIYNQVEVHKAALKQLKWDNIDGVLQGSNEVTEMNSALENVAMALGKHVSAFQHQDHLAHLQSHVAFYQDPAFGASKSMAPQFIPGFVEHCKQHVLMFYLQSMDFHTRQNGGTHEITKTTKGQDRLIAAASKLVGLDSQDVLAGILPVIDQALQQLSQANQAGGNLPPEAQVLMQTAKMENERKTQEMQQKAQTEQAKIQAAQQKAQQDAEVKMQVAQLQTSTQREIAEAKTQADLTKVDRAAFHDGGSVDKQHMHEKTLAQMQHELDMMKEQLAHQRAAEQSQMQHQQSVEQLNMQHQNAMAQGGAVHQQNMEAKHMDHQNMNQMEQQKMQHQGSLEMQKMAHGGMMEQQKMQHAQGMEQSKQQHDRYKHDSNMSMQQDQHAYDQMERMTGEQSKMDHEKGMAQMSHDQNMETTKMQQKHEVGQTYRQQSFDKQNAAEDRKHQQTMAKMKPQPKPGGAKK